MGDATFDLVPVDAETTHGNPGARRALEWITGVVEGSVAALNGIAGDYIAGRRSNIAIPMGFYHNRKPLAVDRASLLNVHPNPSSRIAVFVHGLCCNERIWHFWGNPEKSYGSLLQRDLGHTPFYVRYNTGLHVSENGRSLSDLLESLVRQYPEPLREIVLIGHSKGGLVLRSACHYGQAQGASWTRRVGRVVFLGSPHLGAPLEKLANIFTSGMKATGFSFAGAVADFINFRSAAIKDLRFGYTLDEEWRGKNPDALMKNHRRTPRPIPGASHYFAAASLTKNPRHLVTQCLGDILVRVPSALGMKGRSADQFRVFTKTNHFALTMDSKVYWQLRDWCQGPAPRLEAAA